MAVPSWLKAILHHYQIPYEERHHPPVFSAPRLAQAEHVPGTRVAKTVFVTVKQKPVAIVLSAHERLDMARVQSVLSTQDVKLAGEDEISGWFKGCQPGSVPPLRLRPNLQILMDRSVAHMGKILFPAGTQEDAIVVSFRDWYRAVRPGIGRFAAPVNGHNGAMHRGPVLVVEDEADTNRLMCMLLERKGVACRGALEGRQALAMAAELQPSAILLDLMLPDISGFEVYEILKRTGPFKRIPVIVVTALDDDDSRNRIEALGADAYLTKPFRPDVLMDEVQGALADARG